MYKKWHLYFFTGLIGIFAAISIHAGEFRIQPKNDAQYWSADCSRVLSLYDHPGKFSIILWDTHNKSIIDQKVIQESFYVPLYALNNDGTMFAYVTARDQYCNGMKLYVVSADNTNNIYIPLKTHTINEMLYPCFDRNTNQLFLTDNPNDPKKAFRLDRITNTFERFIKFNDYALVEITDNNKITDLKEQHNKTIDQSIITPLLHQEEIPSPIADSYVRSQLMKQVLKVSAIAAISVGIVATVGYLVYKKIIQRKNKNNTPTNS